MSMFRILGTLLIGAIIFPVLGCTHAMKVKNLQRYTLTPTHALRRDVAVLSHRGGATEEIFFEHVVDALRAHPSVAQLRTNWRWDAPEIGFEPDVVISIEQRARYRGSGWNLPITWPGFLLFTHAWNGYVYYADVHTDILIHDPDTRLVEERAQLDLTYSMRHCDFGRGFWAASGWWMPGYSATALLSGLVFVGYDKDATDEFHEEIRRPFGDYVAEKIMSPALTFAEKREQRLSIEAASIETPAGVSTPRPEVPPVSTHPPSGME